LSDDCAAWKFSMISGCDQKKQEWGVFLMTEFRVSHDKEFRGIVVVTGCDSGIGRSIAEILLRKGYTLVLSYLEENHFVNADNVHTKKMDLRIPEEVQEFCLFAKRLSQEGKKLEAIVMNAGVALGGPIENLPLAIYRECFEINYFGVVAIIQSLIPELIRDKGRIVVIGSMAGRIALPFLSPYVSTKFALEGFCDSLRREMNPLGVKTILIEPAAVATPIWNKAKQQDVSFVDDKYMKSLYRFRDNFIEGGNQGLDTNLAASMIAEIVFKKKPKDRYIITKNKLMSRLMLLLPAYVIDKAVAKMYQMDYGAHN